MVAELGVHSLGPIMNIEHTSSPAAYKDYLYVITGNGVDDLRERVPAPDAPSLVCFDKETGKVVWKDNSPGKNILDGQWGSPLVAEINGRPQVIAPFGDGWLRSFDPVNGKPLWQFDTNPKNVKYALGGKGKRNYLLTAPVLYEGRIYISNGQQPEHGDGPGWLHCIDPTKSGDVSRQLPDGSSNENSAAIWSFGPGEQENDPLLGMRRSVSNVCVGNGLVIAPTLGGIVHCLDARTGKRLWAHDTLGDIYVSPMIVDGRVYLVTQDSDILILALAREKRVLRKHDLGDGWSTSSAVFANGVLYLARHDMLFAIKEQR
jgi:outer membrane protein assembly factor BamB